MYAPIMAATILITLTYFLIFNVFTNDFKSNSYPSEDFYPYEHLQHKMLEIMERKTGFDKQTTALVLHFNLTARKSTKPHMIRFAIYKWTRHGYTLLASPERSYVPDLTIHIDVHPNPGWESTNSTQKPSPFPKQSSSHANVATISTNIVSYHNLSILHKPSPVFQKLNHHHNPNLGLYNLRKNPYRRSRAGKRVQEKRKLIFKKIQVVVTHWRTRTKSKLAYCGGINKHNLITSTHENTIKVSASAQHRSVSTNVITIARSPLTINTVAQPKSVALSLLNARSVKNKSFIIKDFVVDNNIGILAITETWLQDDISNQITINNICPTGFVLHNLPRVGSRGGGVALLYKNRFRLKKLSMDISYNSFEFTDCVVSYLTTTLRIVVVYRPPPSRKNHLNVTVFFEEFSSFLERIVTTTGPLVIIGDFNFHLDNKNDRSAARFKEQLNAFSLVQHVRESTHKNGHTLDLVITRTGEEIVRNVRVSDPAISDHCAVHCEALCLIKPSFEKRKVSYRKLCSLDNELFIQDIMKSTLMNHGLTDVQSLVNCYYKTLRSLLDKHAPEKSRIVTIRPAAPWYSDIIRHEKTKRRKLERTWRKNKLTIHREMYVAQCTRVNALIHESKMQFYANAIDENANDQRVLFSAIGKMLNLKSERKLPSHDNERDLANQFVEFFSEKVLRIRTSLPLTLHVWTVI